MLLRAAGPVPSCIVRTVRPGPLCPLAATQRKRGNAAAHQPMSWASSTAFASEAFWVARVGTGTRLSTGTRATSQEGEALSTQFAAYVNREGFKEPLQDRRPTPLLSPTAVIAAQMDALHRSDWPEAGAGLRAAFGFSKPHGCEEILAGRAQVVNTHARSWGAAEKWLTCDGFAAELLLPPFCLLIDCDSWKAASRLVFPSSRMGNRAIQTVQIRTSRTLQPVSSLGGGSSTNGSSSGSEPRGAGSLRQAPAAAAAGGQPSQGISKESGMGAVDQLRDYKFTFCLERIDVGAYKGCWLTVGVRSGDYGNV